MTEDDARNFTGKENPPWDEPTMLFIPGRFYHSLNFVSIPPGKIAPRALTFSYSSGASITSQTAGRQPMRFRYYVTDDPWDGKDRKSWRVGHLRADTGKDIDALSQEFLDTIAAAYGLVEGAAPAEIYRLIFKGNCDAACETMMREKPFWMHAKPAP